MEAPDSPHDMFEALRQLARPAQRQFPQILDIVHRIA